MADSFTQQSVEANLLKVFDNHKHGNVTVSTNSVITADLGVDSLAVMEIVAELEDTYDLTFPDDELPGIKTVGDVVQLICRGLRQDGRLAQ